jgi:hypothetical protein
MQKIKQLADFLMKFLKYLLLNLNITLSLPRIKKLILSYQPSQDPRW